MSNNQFGETSVFSLLKPRSAGLAESRALPDDGKLFGECDLEVFGSAFSKEWVRRTLDVVEALAQGGLIARQLQVIRGVVAFLKVARRRQGLSLEAFALSLGIEPLKLCLFENGLLSKEEFLGFADMWGELLEVDLSEYVNLVKDCDE